MKTEDRFESLPEVLGEVTAPRLLPPSGFASLMRCPLKVIHDVPEEDMLAPSPLAILGTVIHEVMQRARNLGAYRREQPSQPVDDLFEDELRRMEKGLSKDARTKRLVPIRRAVGKTEYQIRRARLRTWAKTLLGADERHYLFERPSKTSGLGRNQEDEIADTTRIPTGPEQPLRVSSLRLSGRPDLIEPDSEGAYHVTDFKTGHVVDRVGDLREDYALQLRLYALMLEEIDTTAKVRLWLEGAERAEVPWSHDYREETMEKLLSVSEELPAGRTLSAAELAQDGPHCGSCKIKDRCPRYRSVAPAWWKKKSCGAVVAPFDIWGTVGQVVADGESTVEVTLQDDADRPAQVSGIEAQSLHPGDRVWFFDLEPTQTLHHQGVFVHPRNFRRYNRLHWTPLPLPVAA